MSFSTASAKQLRAIRNYSQRGYVPQLSVWPTVTFLKKTTGEKVDISMDDLISEYEQDLKERAKERARERRIHAHHR